MQAKCLEARPTEAKGGAPEPPRGSELGTNSVCYGGQRGRKFLLFHFRFFCTVLIFYHEHLLVL